MAIGTLDIGKPCLSFVLKFKFLVAMGILRKGKTFSYKNRMIERNCSKYAAIGSDFGSVLIWSMICVPYHRLISR